METEDLWKALRARIDEMVREAAAGDPTVERFLRRKLENWAIDQGSLKVMNLKDRLKKIIYSNQSGLCLECLEPLPPKGWELDRLSAAFHDEPDQGYRLENVRGVHAHCNPRGPHPAGRPPVR